MATVPTKPLYTVRFTLLNTRYYTAAEIRKAFEPALKDLGFIIYQTPAVNTYQAKFSLSKEGPFDYDDTKAVYETMTIEGPAGKAVAVAKDLTNDPKGSRPILEQRKPLVTAIAWNLGPPSSAIGPQVLADAIWRIRKEKLADTNTMTGMGWTPVCKTWLDTPVKLPPYPDRPAIPEKLLPPKPKPKPKPKPEPKPEPIVIPPTPPVPVVAKPNYWKWGVAGLGGLLLFAMADKR